ncbi:MAG: MAPEG family protein [Rhodanobacteraceae bacterium]|nr:MAPEG family protein [Rhodanobacteraceae bacterium]
MNNLLILQPAAALALFTLTVLLLIPIRRMQPQLANEIEEDDFKYGESARVPAYVSIPNRNYMNLLELPVLFYAACLLIFGINQLDATYRYLAWGYVALRVVHSTIHLTYNRVRHRVLVFAISNVVLTVIWVRVALALW